METDVKQKNGTVVAMATNKSDNAYTITVNVSPGTDLNTPIPSQPWNEIGLKANKRFPNEVYENLPELQRLLCQKIIDTNEREVLFVGLLGVVSGILPNVCGYYGGKLLQPNLFTYTLGPYGEGKSGLMWARKIAEPIHKEKHEMAKELRKAHRDEMARYKKEFKLFEQGKLDKMPEQPEQPPHLKLYIPSNIGKTGMLQLLEENQGRGILFETEADTLADAIKQDHGGFSDVLRQSFGHEPISFFRRTNNEDVEILSPALSVVLSSTHDQLLKLIPTIENGLFSRFLYYEFDSTPEFNDVFDKSKNGYSRYFSEMGLHFKELYDKLTALSSPFFFELQPHQEKKFLKVFSEQKSEMREYISSSLGGTVNRMAMICFRIAMQLSICRAFEKGYLPLELVCSDQDFENALRISSTFSKHTIAVYDKLPKARSIVSEQSIDKDAVKLEQKRQCLELYDKGVKSVREISTIVFGSEGPKSTVHRWIKGL
ncbi:DUF3987 domain-containing protein [Pontibacter silvestris]|uniref:DUF3987 domain-containing protein n=1 Tax=Pontibacter silvestris TaxID=2305183 RepID=A0ABW4X385_9BACT|nr:DUF3987 domain-containing protein [Pontibacter silvestris]MCC9134989.1 DUF3987 domain-containing protein [Pontibacter silvestris]